MSTNQIPFPERGAPTLVKSGARLSHAPSPIAAPTP